MRQSKRWRYFCDFCNKSFGQKNACIKHEKRCTNNPDRVCGHCNKVDSPFTFSKGTVDALLVVSRMNGDFQEGAEVAFAAMSPKTYAWLKEHTENCPTCMLAAMRLSKLWWTDFDYKKELKEFWDSYNSDINHDWGY